MDKPIGLFPFSSSGCGAGWFNKPNNSSCLFGGFEIGEGRSDVIVSHLKFVDDALLIGEASVETVWVMKVDSKMI